jgi:hypothetical protein
VFTVVAAAVTVASAAVAGAGDGDEAIERIARSGEALAKSRSAKFRGTTTTDRKGADARVTFDGRFDFANRAGEYSVDATAIGLQGNGKVRTLLVGGIVFLSLDALEGTTAIEGKKWLRLDPSIFGGEGQIGQSDPNGGLDALRGVTGAVENRGTQDVRGVRTTHYRVKIDPGQAVTNAPEELREAVRSAVRPLGSDRVPADVWLDSRDRLRKVRLRVGSGSLTSPKGSVGFEYYGLGANVSVAAPPAGEVVDFSEILAGTTESTPST